MGKTQADLKIFGIGLNKTGTTTLGKCGKVLGYRVKGCDRKLLEDVVKRNDLSGVREIANQYDLFEDWPWPLLYKELDQMFPGSKFILTIRKDEKTWFESIKKHAIQQTGPRGHCRKLAYGYSFPHRHEEEHIAIYKRHNKDVKDYFIGRESEFIEVCWETGDGWSKLCEFLGKDIPNIPFPHANKGSTKRVSYMKQLINQLLSRVCN